MESLCVTVYGHFRSTFFGYIIRGGRFSIALQGTGCNPQTPLSHEEKWSGESSWISWASTCFCDSV